MTKLLILLVIMNVRVAKIKPENRDGEVGYSLDILGTRLVNG